MSLVLWKVILWCTHICCLILNVLRLREVNSNRKETIHLPLGLYSLSGKTSYRKISWCFEAARLGVIMIVSLWNLTGISTALLPRCLLNFRAIGKVQTRISRLRDFTRSCGKTSYRLVNRGPGETMIRTWHLASQVLTLQQTECPVTNWLSHRRSRYEL